METTAVQDDTDAALTDNMVLVVAQDGRVATVLEIPDSMAASVVAGANVDDLWPETVAQRLRRTIRSALRSRRFQCDEANLAQGRSQEFICVPQGPDRVLVVVRDRSASQAAKQKVETLAYTDDVTGLPNREFLMTELKRVTERYRLTEGRAAVICIHVEQFDDDGHALVAGSGDAVLKELASRLSMQLRGINDTTQRDFDRFSIVARADYRQFAIVLPSIEIGEDAESVAMRLLGSLGQPMTVGTREFSAAAFAGIALFPQDGSDADELYANARTAMEDARHSPTDPYRFHSGTVRLRALQRQDLAADLRAALERDEYTLGFLPVVDAASGRVRSLEALLRWPQTVLGARSTRKVVAIAEYTGLIVDIGRWVLRSACASLKSWQEELAADLRVAVNLSAQEFARPDLATDVREALDTTGVEPGTLELEIRENMIVRDALQRFSTCHGLREIGVSLALDDYGTGTSALAQLAECPVDTLKIDSSFVANIESSDQDRATCAAAISVAHSLGRKVIAEGVETEAQAGFLRARHCDFLQGFLLARPLAAEEVVAYVRSLAIDTDAVRAS